MVLKVRVPGQTAAASLGNLLEMHILELYPRPVASEILEVEAQQSAFHKFPR